MHYKLFFKWRKIELKWMIKKVDFLKHYVKGAVERIVCSIDDDFFVQCSCRSNLFFHHIRLIKELTIFYVFKMNISNWAKAIFANVDFVELNVILCVIYNFYDAILYELTSAIVIQLKMNAFINKLNKRTSVKDTLQVDIFIKTSFFI